MIDLEEIMDICAEYTGPGYYVGEWIPESKLRNASASFPIPAGEQVAALIDATVFGSAKNGLAICSSGVYWHNDWTTPAGLGYLAWEDFAEQPILRSGRQDIELGPGNVADLSGCSFPKDALIDLLAEIQEYVNDALYEDGSCPTCELGETDWEEEEDSDAEWMIAMDGQAYGPFAPELVKSMTESGQIDPDSAYVWKAGMPDWVPFRQQPETAAFAGPPAPPSAPPASRSSSAAPAAAQASSADARIEAALELAGAGTEAGASADSGEPIDVNAAPRDRLLDLPGIGLAEAERIVRLRDSGGFRSAEQLGERLGLKPHQVVKLKKRAVFGGTASASSAPAASSSTPASRTASPSSARPSSSAGGRSSARIIDY